MPPYSWIASSRIKSALMITVLLEWWILYFSSSLFSISSPTSTQGPQLARHYQQVAWQGAGTVLPSQTKNIVISSIFVKIIIPSLDIHIHIITIYSHLDLFNHRHLSYLWKLGWATNIPSIFFTFPVRRSAGLYGIIILKIILMRKSRDIHQLPLFETLNQSPTNNSKSKTTFSFSKTPRFPLTKATCPISTYAGAPIERKNSGTAMGYGTKYDFTKTLDHTPESGLYSFTSAFEVNKKERRGYTLANSRERIKFDSYIDSSKTRIPGIGRYKLESELMVRTSRAPSFSMSLKTRPTDLTKTIEAQNHNPSPAEYENNPEMSKTLFGSHFKSTSFSQSKSKRFFKADNKIPGPGDYENPTNLSSIGKYLLSSSRGGTNAKFNNAKRVTKFDQIQKEGAKKPGPGSYRTNSQFGIYDSEIYMKTSLRK